MTSVSTRRDGPGCGDRAVAKMRALKRRGCPASSWSCRQLLLLLSAEMTAVRLEITLSASLSAFGLGRFEVFDPVVSSLSLFPLALPHFALGGVHRHIPPLPRRSVWLPSPTLPSSFTHQFRTDHIASPSPPTITTSALLCHSGPAPSRRPFDFTQQRSLTRPSSRSFTQYLA